jgi:hypothetical protein
MLFTCTRVDEIWRILGIKDQLTDFIMADRSGSVVIQDIILRGGRIQDLNTIGFAELVLTAGWYIWWERRQITHGESVQVPHRSGLSIIAITTNYIKTIMKAQTRKKEGWKKLWKGSL